MKPHGSCALGIAPHSGWAVVVILGGARAEPRVLLRERIELADQRLAGSKQPYHAIEGRPLTEAQQRLVAFQTSANRLALAALRTLTQTLLATGAQPRAAGIVASSGRVGATLEATLASHALIHTADGNHFRDALSCACETLGFAVTRIPQRTLQPQAEAALGVPAQRLAATLTALGRGWGAPWGADQKAAALLAWLLL
jgi:hypothetical protein